MEPADLNFLKMYGYSIDSNKSITKLREHAVRFLEDGTPDWPHMLRVTDFVLFELDVVKFQPCEKADPDSNGYWVPYKFWLDSHGDCVVRAWLSS